MLMRMPKYDVPITYMYTRGKDLHLADCLSRAFIEGETRQEDFERISMVEFFPISESRLQKIRRATEEDECLQGLKRIVLQGWPNNKTEVPSQVMPYFPYRDEICSQDGLLFRSQ